MQISNDLARDIKREVLSNNYFEFFCWAFDLLHPTAKYSDNFHVKYLCDILQEEAERILRLEEKDKDLLINIPPRTSKSLIFSVCLLPWVWIKNPSKKFICISNDDQLALLNSQLCRDIIAHPEYQELFGDCYFVRGDTDSKGHFANNFGGYRISRTSGTNITGLSADWIIVDDPDSAQKVYSEAERKKVHTFYFEALYNRLTPPNLGIRVVLQQRLHEQDLTGAILQRQSGKYKHICLPAEITAEQNVSPPELKEFYKENLLDPNRLSKEILNDFKNAIGSKAYQSQYNQRPAPDEGGILKKEWFDIILATNVVRDSINNPVHFILDTAYTEKQENDASAIITFFVRNNCIYVLDCHEVRMEFPDLLKHIVEHVKKYQYSDNSKILIEPKASGKSLVQQLKISTKLNVMELDPPKDSKLVRANSVAPIVEAKRVILVDGSYIQKFLEQIVIFPNGEHDDMLDVLVYAIQRFLQKTDTPDMVFLNM